MSLRQELASCPGSGVQPAHDGAGLVDKGPSSAPPATNHRRVISMGMGKETWEPIDEAFDAQREARLAARRDRLEDELEREAYERNARFDEED